MSATTGLRRAAGLVVLGELAGVALLVAAGALIGWSARQPSWTAIGLLLFVVELLAFLRAPLRYAGQLAGHDLGTAELSRWRHRLVVGLGASVRSLASPVASGDALERMLADAQVAAERHQRVGLARLAATTTAAAGIALAAVADPAAAAILATGALGTALGLAASRPGLASAEAELAVARHDLATRAAEAVEARVELGLMGAGDFLDARWGEAVSRQARSARRLRRARGLAAGAATLPAVTAAYAVVVLLGAQATTWAVGTLVLAVGLLEAAGLATSAALADPEARLAIEAIEGLPQPSAPRTRGEVTPGASALSGRGLVVRGADGELLLAADGLELAPGELVAVVGPSGAGKSTLLAALAGIAPLAEGESAAAGVVLQGLADGDRARLVAYVGHEDGILPGSLRDALAMGRRDLPDEVLLDALARVGLAEQLAARGGLGLELEAGGANLSTGERRRVAVARALATGAPVWLLDEPAAGLDPEGADALGEAIAELGRDRAVLVVTHRDEDAARATRQLEVRDGRLGPRR